MSFKKALVIDQFIKETENNSSLLEYLERFAARYYYDMSFFSGPVNGYSSIEFKIANDWPAVIVYISHNNSPNKCFQSDITLFVDKYAQSEVFDQTLQSINSYIYKQKPLNMERFNKDHTELSLPQFSASAVFLDDADFFVDDYQPATIKRHY